MASMDEKPEIAEAIAQATEVADETGGEKELVEKVPKKPKAEKKDQEFFSYEDEMCEHMKTTSEKVTFLESRSLYIFSFTSASGRASIS